MKHLLFVALFATPLQALDLNSDGLPDVWQQRFNAQTLLPLADDDGDGFLNITEADAGTDPFLVTDFPDQVPLWTSSLGSFPLQLSIPTLPGKNYQVSHSTDLANFEPFGPPFPGTGNIQSLTIAPETISTRNHHVIHELWADVPGTDLSGLVSLPDFPGSPDGTSALSSFEIPASLASGFGGRFRALITPPQTGNYSFSLSSAGAASLHLSTDATASNLVRQAEVLGSQTGIPVGNFTSFPEQQSSAIPLIAGDSYLLEIRYLASTPYAHCQAAWSGPGLSGTEIIPAAAPSPLIPQSVPRSSILLRNYDTGTETGKLWKNSGTVLRPGFSGNAEVFTADPSGSDDLAILDSATTNHFYANFVFQMERGHRDLDLYFRNSETSSQDGPRVDLEDSTNGTLAVVRPNGQYQADKQIVVTFGEPYRVEIIASISPGGFQYQADLATLTVAEDTFDLYVSDLRGNLVGRTLGVPFRDSGANVVQKIDAIRAGNVFQPNIALDDWEITNGSISGTGYLAANTQSFEPNTEKQFFRVGISDSDQDHDGLSDWEEMQLAQHAGYLFFDSESNNGTSDADSLAALLSSSTGPVEVSLQASDTAAFERNSPNLGEDHGEITVTRTGPLTPLTINLCQAPLANTGNTATICDGTCCTLIGTAGDEEAEIDDYTLLDPLGNVVTNTLTFGFGEMTKILTVIATPDSTNEYPETLNIAIEPDDSATYKISNINGASIQLFDLPEHPDNTALFTGKFSQDGNAVVASNGSGFTTATLNGPRTKLLLWNEFSNLTSVQQDSHIHKSNRGPAPGAIIYAITNVPGDESGNSPDSDPLNGPLTAYPWDLSTSSGAVPSDGGAASKQVLIDSLFNQNNESPLYLNIHTVDNPAGEIWAFLELAGGSQIEPDDPATISSPGSSEYPMLAGAELESEVRRFLNQATFGATEEEVETIVKEIEDKRETDPSYHRHAAYTAWLDDQIDTIPQTYLLDYNLATDFQVYDLAGYFDPSRNPGNDTTPTPSKPAPWPSVDRSNPNPDKWHLSAVYPVNRDIRDLADDNDLFEPDNRQRRQTHWQMMINANDQLRQKMGFALQQIVVVSASLDSIRDNPYGASNYQDQLNHHAFNHYRDVLGFVNWSPLMGKWLSSLQNQKAADLDGDGEFDIYPDENLARENMQLFSIGLFEMWEDGTLRLGSDGLPIPTYTNDDIREFAKVLTGQSFGQYNSTSASWGGVPFDSMVENDNFFRGQNTDGHLSLRYSYPMKMFGEFHSPGPKSFAGTTIDNTHLSDPTEQGIADIEDAMDWLAGKKGAGQSNYDMVTSHRSTPAFICRRLIQRFTTSNPSRDYLHRVAHTFRENEGNLELTIRAILLDPEARVPDLTDTTFGIKKSPLESYLQVLRTMGAYSLLSLSDDRNSAPFATAPGNYSNASLYLKNFGLPAAQLANQQRNFRFLQDYTITSGSADLQMVPFRQETVFNWYRPDYAPGGAIANAGLVAPELQLSNEPDVIRNINYFNLLTRSRNGALSEPLGGSSTNQRLALGLATNDNTADQNDRIRLDLQVLADTLYPPSPPTPVNGRTSESLADEILVDELDRRLTLGYLKLKYPYDRSDDDDPAVPGPDDLLKNPRELIIDAVSSHGNPFSGNNDANDRRYRFSDALYLITFTPEFQVRK